MPQQELDLLQVATGLATELCTSPPEIMRTESLDPDLLRGLSDHRPDRPVAQAVVLLFVVAFKVIFVVGMPLRAAYERS